MLEYSQAFFIYSVAIKVCDALTVMGLWYLSWYIRFHTTLLPTTKGIPNLQQYSDVTLPLVLVYIALFHVVGAYRRDRVHFGFRSLKKIVQGSVLGILVFISILYFLDQANFSRIFLALFPLICIVGIFIERGILNLLWLWMEHKCIKKIRVLMVGNGAFLKMYYDKLEKRKPYPIEWLGRLGEAGDSFDSVPYLGKETEVLKTVRENAVDNVILSYPTGSQNQYAEVLSILSNEIVSVKVIPDFGKYSTFTYLSDQECGIPLLAFNQPPLSATDRFFKRTLDVLGSLFFLIFFSPLFLLIALLVRLTSRGPAIYSQSRIGADGNTFLCYKFRSMGINAEEETGAIWASKNDDRVTPLGKWLRKTSLDELPQFYNVLKGNMSLVGPRPERPVFVDQFRNEIPRYMLRHRLKSGITGWAQINGWRGNTSIEERIKHDLFYIGHWSLYFDFKILVLTLFKGFVHKHAY